MKDKVLLERNSKHLVHYKSILRRITVMAKPCEGIPLIQSPSGKTLYGGGVAVDIKKIEQYQTLRTWAQKVEFVLREEEKPMLKGDIFAELMKYERHSELDKLVIQKELEVDYGY